MSYNLRKAAQTIAFFILKNGGKPINTVKTVKLVYLADRESIARFCFPIQDEKRVSMRYGPVNSQTYDYIKGEVSPDSLADWNEFVSDRENYLIGCSNPSITIDELDELSDSDIEVLEKVWADFGHMNQWQIVDYTHNPENIPEWRDPKGSSEPIDLRDIMEALNCPNIDDALGNYNVAKGSERFFSEL